MRGERAGHSLQATAFVNEAYLLLVDAQRVNWKDRAHFMSMAARLMRQVLVDHARTRRSLKRGGGQVKVTLVDDLAVSGERERDLLALDDALTALATVDERKSRVVELRFFGGLSVEETAAVLNVSVDTVMRGDAVVREQSLRSTAAIQFFYMPGGSLDASPPRTIETAAAVADDAAAHIYGG